MNATNTLHIPAGLPCAEISFEDIFSDGITAREQLLCLEAQALTNTWPADGVAEKELAILFLDLRNYTGLLQSQPAKEIIAMVKKLFGVFNKVISAFGGRVIDRAGDSLYAVFGLKNSIREAANQAYRATQMLFNTLEYFNTNFAIARYGSPFEIGIGLHAGEVVIDQQTNENGSYLSVMGLPVNIAARLQAKTKVLNNDLIMSEKVFGLLDNENKPAGTGYHRIELQGVADTQPVRLAGKAYVSHKNAVVKSHDMDYLLAIAG